MTVEVNAEATRVGEVVSQKVEALKVVEDVETKKEEEVKPKIVDKSSSFREESSFLSDLKENERKALNELKSKLKDAILGNIMFKKDDTDGKGKPAKEGEAEKPTTEEKQKDQAATEGGVGEEKSGKEEPENKEESKPEEGNENEEKKLEGEKGGVESAENDAEKKTNLVVEEVDEDISVWGVPLLPTKGDEGTDVLLLKFLRARDFKVNDAYEMLKNMLQWRKENKLDSILDEDLGKDLSSASYMAGVDREGHPICYNIFGALDDEEIYQKTFGTEEKREQFLRWRFQLMEKGIQKLDFKPGGINSLLQINDLKNSPGPSKKEVRLATKQAVGLLQDNYPEFVARNIFINVPFWYYAFHALMSPFLTQRTKSKFLVARPAKVTETLLKYIPIEEIPVQYGGLKRETDFEFSADDGVVSELLIKPSSTATIEITTPEVGATFIWDVTVLGWEVNYSEEFVPADEGSYTIVVQKAKKIGANEGVVRNTFRTNEPGTIVLTIENTSSKKKRAFYRYKTKKSSF